MSVYVGSSCEDSVGVGTLLIGTDFIHCPNDEFGEYQLLIGVEWFYCFDVVEITPDIKPVSNRRTE